MSRPTRGTEAQPASMEPAPIIVQQGKILDYIDALTQRKETPEEYVRQEIAKSLVREYDYEKQEISVEFTLRLGSRRPRADLQDSLSDQLQQVMTNVASVSTFRNTRTEALAQSMLTIQGSKQQPSCVGSEAPSIKTRRDLSVAVKWQGILADCFQHCRSSCLGSLFL